MKKFIFVLSIVCIFIPVVSNADGMILPHPDYYMNETGQRAVIFHEDGIETIVLSVSFSGDASDFAWVIPIPSKPEVSKGSDEIFTSLAEIVQPVRWGRPVPLLESLGRVEEEQVTVVETKKVDYYDITVLQSTDSQALAKWLNKNDYEYPEESSYILNDYIENKWYFIAVKIDATAAEADEVQQGLREGHATPLKIEFASNAIIYPLRISSITTQPKVVQLSRNLFLNQARIDHLKAIGYESLTKEEEVGKIQIQLQQGFPIESDTSNKTLTGKESGSWIFNKIVEDLVNNVAYLDAVAANYPLIISEDKYREAKVGLVNYQDYPEGKIPATDHYQRQVEKVFNDYFNQQGLYYNQDAHQYIPIHLYVIAGHKKDVPGFSASYANKIKKNQIENLAYDLNGEPLIQPKENKYWLTYLFRNMKISEMTSDLVIRDASDDNKVGTGSAVKNWGILWLGLIIYFICVIGWIFSPFGLMFIGFSVLQFLSKHRKAQITAWVFQILTLVVSLGMFGFWSIFLTKFGWYQIMSIYPSSGVTSGYLIALPVILAQLTILAGSIVVMILQARHHSQLALESSPRERAGVPKEPVQIAKTNKVDDSTGNKKEKKNSLPKPRKIVMLVW